MRKILSLLLVVFVCVELLDGQAWAKGKPSSSEDGDNAMAALHSMLVERNKAEYRRLGLSDETARWAAWADSNYPASSCSINAGLLKTREGSERDTSVGIIESTGICRKDQIIKSSKAYLENLYHPKKRIYDPSQDGDRNLRLYFRDHYNEAIKMLMDVGTTEAAARRTADLVIHDGPDSTCRSEVGTIYAEQKEGLRKDRGYQFSYSIAKELNREHYCDRYESDLGSRH